MQQALLFSDPKIIEALENSIPESEMKLSDGSYIVLKKISNLIAPRPPSIPKDEYQLVFWDKELTLGIINFSLETSTPSLILRLHASKYKSCSLAQLKDFLMKRSDSLREWLIWNLI
jgi:hypothetical protein